MKRAQDPFTLVFKGFGFCEFESTEGLLPALRPLNNFSIDGQQLLVRLSDTALIPSLGLGLLTLVTKNFRQLRFRESWCQMHAL